MWIERSCIAFLYFVCLFMWCALMQASGLGWLWILGVMVVVHLVGIALWILMWIDIIRSNQSRGRWRNL